MAFQIAEIVDSQTENMLARVNHQNHQITATVRNEQRDDILVGKSFQAEIAYDEILDWKVVEGFRDEQSGIWQEGDGIHLSGRIHNVLDYGDGKTIVDVYIHNGPELFTVNSDAMEDLSFDANMGLEIVVRNLYIQPVL